MADLKETPLIDEHRVLKALLAPFGGWNMPIQYEGILAEHRWCREKAALFDICHMGEFIFRGDIAAGALDGVFTFPVSAVPVGRSRYGFLLNDKGGIIDDLIVFRVADNEAMVVVNAATVAKDFVAISSRLPDNADFTDISARTGKLDLQGPLSREILAGVIGDEVKELPYFRFRQMSVLGSPAIVSRTGYTGELGYEIFLPADKVAELWKKLLADERVKPAGLGARDVLRLEVGYSLYGSDIDEETTPLEAGLGSFVDFTTSFIGKEALLRQKEEGLSRVKAAFKVGSRRSPRHDYEILAGGVTVGKVTSGVFSPMLTCGIGMGYVSPASAEEGTPIAVVHGSVSMDATIVALPFYAGGSVRS